jgi:hypothetical protein
LIFLGIGGVALLLLEMKGMFHMIEYLLSWVFPSIFIEYFLMGYSFYKLSNLFSLLKNSLFLL